MDPTSRSVVARLRVISMAVWVMCTVGGGVLGSGFALAESGAMSGATIAFWHKAALIGIVAGTGALGCFVGYFAKVFIDWACRVLVVLDQLSKK